MKKVTYKSAIPIYIAAAVWLVMGLIFPKFLLGVGGLIVTAVLSAAAWFGSKRFFPDRVEEVREEITTGDKQLDQNIAQARDRLEKLRQANAAIDHPEISRNLDRMTVAGEQIFKELGRDPRKYSMVRRFMSYYLPTSEKLMEQYQLLMNTDTKGEKIQSSMKQVESSLGMIADAFEKCADNLFADSEMDIDTDIQVMKTMLSGDELITDETNAAFKGVAQPGESEGIKLTLGGK